MPFQEFSLKKSSGLYLFLAILFTGGLFYFVFGPYNQTRAIFEANFLAAIILTTFLLIVTAYTWYSFFDRSNIVTFNTKGITYKKMHIPWQGIKSYKTINYTSDTIDTLHLVLTLLNSGKEHTINLFGLNTDKQHIRDCIEKFSTIPIADEGHSEKN